MTWIAVGAAVAVAGFWAARRRRGRNSGAAAAADARTPHHGGDAGAHAHGTLKHGNQIRDIF